jgi:outer membrane protein
VRAVGAFVVTILAILAMNAHAADLLHVYQLAQANDPQFQKAKAQHAAALENKPIAIAGLLPSLNVSAHRTITRQNGSEPLGFSRTGPIQGQVRTRFYSSAYTVQLTQPVFHWDRWVQLAQADAQIAQAEAVYEAAQQSLIVRVAQAYFNLLNARDTLASTRANKASTAKQLERAKTRYHVGMASTIDVQEARAAYDRLVAQEVANEQTLRTTRQALTAIIGKPIERLAEPKAGTPLKAPVPHSPKAWVKTALHQNPNLNADRFAAKVANKNVDLQAAAHYPTLDLVLDHTKSNSSDDIRFFNQGYNRRTDINGNSIMLQLNWPIFSGGAVFARTRQAKHQYHAAEDQLVLTARQTVRTTRDAYLGVIAGIAQVKSLKQAVQSSQTSLRATQEGLKIGTRTTVDVLSSRQNLLSAQTSYAQSRYNYLVSGLQLKQAAGTLDAEDVKAINRFLTKAVDVDIPFVSETLRGGKQP